MKRSARQSRCGGEGDLGSRPAASGGSLRVSYPMCPGAVRCEQRGL